jgi:hypothetical protein
MTPKKKKKVIQCSLSNTPIMINIYIYIYIMTKKLVSDF